GDLGLDPLVVLGHLLRPGVIRTEAFKQRSNGHAANCEPLGAIEEGAAIDIAMHVLVEQIQQFLWVIGGFLTLQGESPSSVEPITRSARAGPIRSKNCDPRRGARGRPSYPPEAVPG